MQEVYSYEDVKKSALEYFKGDDLAASVWLNKYALKDSYGNIYERNPDDMFRRIAKEIVRVENKYNNPMSEDEVFNLMSHFRYIIPQGGPLTGIGNDFQISSISNCFVIGKNGMADSYGAIMQIDEEQVQIMKRRGGVGHDLSHLRPKGFPVKNSALTSTGAISFMERYSNSTREVAQDGRRGALMLSLHINSVEAADFINAKLDNTKVTGANISIKITDAFMFAVMYDSDFIQRYPIDADISKLDIPVEYNVTVYDKSTGIALRKVKAKELWDNIIYNAWKNGEPGILFWDKIISESPADCYDRYGYRTVGTNPCIVADTLIKTDKGEITVLELMNRFKEGEEFNILSYEVDTDTLEFCRLENAFLTRKNAEILSMTLEDGSVLKLTPNHSVYTENRGWIEAEDLTKTDILLQVEDFHVNRTKVVKFTMDNNEDVYDITVNKNHNFFANDILVHNCSEIPLSPYDSCRLLAINLYSYVVDPFTDKARFDYDLFRKHVKIAQRIMDDIIDLELEKIDRIIEKIDRDPEEDSIKIVERNLWNKIKTAAIEGRRTGTGTTGLGDMLAALGLKYGTNEATDFAVSIQKELAKNVYLSSVELAGERGAFKYWNAILEQDSPFINRILNEFSSEEKELYYKNGRRNIACITSAPVGSISILTQTTSGIECLFLPAYSRNRKVNPNDKSVKVSFVDDVGDSWETYRVFHPKFMEWAKINGYDTSYLETCSEEEFNIVYEKSPYYKATANDVDWVSKVSMQGRMQEYNDHATSATTNIPNNATEKVVNDIYIAAWKSGCKGMTVYRDGSRTGVLTTGKKEDKKKDKILKTNAPKRPKSLKCDIHHSVYKGEEWVVIVGILHDDPYEVFAFKQSAIKLSKSIKGGNLIKIKSAHYDLHLDNGGILGNIIELFERSEEEAFTRLISTSLRHGADTKYIVEQLNKAEGNIVSFSKVIARTIKKYIKDDDTPSDKKCPGCGDPEGLKYENGCVSCIKCGYSKC